MIPSSDQPRQARCFPWTYLEYSTRHPPPKNHNHNYHHLPPFFTIAHITHPRRIRQGNKKSKQVAKKDKDLKFTLFPEPLCKVWQFALADFGLRAIEIQYQCKYRVVGGEETENWNHNTNIWWPACIENPPAILWACQEARAKVCKFYTPIRGHESTAVVFCDFSTDYMCFTSKGLLWTWEIVSRDIAREDPEVSKTHHNEQKVFHFLEVWRVGRSLQLHSSAVRAARPVPCEYSPDNRPNGPRTIGFKDPVHRLNFVLKFKDRSQRVPSASGRTRAMNGSRRFWGSESSNFAEWVKIMSWDHLNCSNCFSDSKMSDTEETNESQLHNRYSTSSDVEMYLIVSVPFNSRRVLRLALLLSFFGF